MCVMSSLFVLGAQRKMFSTEGFKLSDRKLTIYWKMIMWKNGLCIILWWIDLTFLINAVECYHFSSSFPKSIQIFTSIELCLCCHLWIFAIVFLQMMWSYIFMVHEMFMKIYFLQFKLILYIIFSIDCNY